MINQKGTVSDHICSSSAAWRSEEVKPKEARMINQKRTVSDHTCSSAAWRVEEVKA